MPFFLTETETVRLQQPFEATSSLSGRWSFDDLSRHLIMGQETIYDS